MGARALQLQPGMGSVWQQMSPFSQFGVRPVSASEVSAAQPGVGAPSIGRSAGPAGEDRNLDKPWHPDNPLFWFGLVAAATFGFAGLSFSARLGPAKAGVALGTT